MLFPPLSVVLIALAMLSLLFAANWLVWRASSSASDDTSGREPAATSVQACGDYATHDGDEFKHVA